MQSIIQAIRSFFNALFGGPKPSTQTPSPQKEVKETPNLPVEIKRYSLGTKDILGKLYIDGKFCCYTLEDAKVGQHVLAGSYELALREKGGLHATYAYKYNDMHHGVLHLTGGPKGKFPFIRTGNHRADTGGGIIVGTEVQGEKNTAEDREVWNSDLAYRKFYPGLAKKLADQGKVMVKIS